MLCRVHHETSNVEPQPVESADRKRRIVFWGDLFDTDRLRGMLGRDRPGLRRADDDAELVLALFEERGTLALQELDGSFAFAIHDALSGQLLLANDRFSSRALYWAQLPDGGVAFSTQVHTVLQAPGVHQSLDQRSVREFFHYQRVHGTRTLSSSVSMLPPGTLLRAADGRISLESWFTMDYCPERRSEAEWVEALADSFRCSTRRSMGGADRVGLLLSGGLDSRMVVAAADREIECFHFNDSRNREYQTARRIAAARRFEFTYLDRPQDHYVNLFDQAVDIGDGQHGFTHGHTIGLLPQDRVDVMLHGYVPEVFFRGTNLPHRRIIGDRIPLQSLDPRLTRDNVAAEIYALIKQRRPGTRPSRFFTKAWANDFEELMLASAQELVDEAQIHSDDPYDWFNWSSTRYHCKIRTFLFEMAIRAFHTERSVVFHNHILDLHLRMPVEMRSDSRLWNRAVRLLAPQVAGVPDANTGHSPFQPESAKVATQAASRIGRRFRPKPKSGPARVRTNTSWPPFRWLIVYNEGLGRLIEDTILDEESIDPDIFDIPTIKSALTDHLAGRADHTVFLIHLATFGSWHRKYGPPGRGIARSPQ